MDRGTTHQTLALVNRAHKTKCKWLHTHRETGCVMKRMNIKPLTKSLLLIAKQLIAKAVMYSSLCSSQTISETHAVLNVTEQAYHSNTTIKYTTLILIKLFDECKPEHQDIPFPDKTLLLRLTDMDIRSVRPNILIGLTAIAIKSETETKKMKIMNLYILLTNNKTKAHGQGM